MYAYRLAMLLFSSKKDFEGISFRALRTSRITFLMRSKTNWPRMDNDIEKLKKTCVGDTLAAKSPSVKFQL